MVASERDVLHTPPLAFIKHEGNHLVVDPEGPNWIATDARGETILRLIDGRRTLGEVAATYARAGSLELAKAWLHVHTFAQAVVRQGMASPSPVQRSPYAGRLAEAPPGGLRELWLHTNNSCNLTCTHCLVSSHPQGDRGPSSATLTGLIRQAHALGVRRFYFTGGEPFVRPDAFDLVDLVTRELGHELIVLTNATLFGPSRRKRLERLDRDRVRFQVSLDGATPGTNDPIRGDGTFSTILQGLETVAGMGFWTSLTCVATASNIDSLPALAGVARATGARSLHLMWMHRRGRAIERLPDQFPANDRLLSLVRDVARECESAGVKLDNLESIRRRIDAPAGVKHDLGNAGWDSLCVYSSGKVFPSAALANVPELVCGDAMEVPLARIWEESPITRELRAATLERKADVRSDPLRFLTGGGDIEHGYLYAAALHGRGSFLGPDPYYGLVRAMTLDAMAGRGGEGRRARNPRMGFDAPLIDHAMGEQAIDCGSDPEVLELDRPVRTLHSNCVLSFEVERPHRVVQEFYGQAARTPQAALCCPVATEPEDTSHIPPAVLERAYGCGSPVSLAAVAPGEIVLDLGSGGGIDCFIAARKVGPQGRVIGVDMTDPMLEVALASRPLVEANLGYANVEFKKGLLEAVPLESRSIDLVTSNCVINLSPDKKKVFSEMWRVLKDHGRAVVSDIVTEVPVPPHLRINPRLWGECLSGALTQEEFVADLREAGFHGITLLKKVFWKDVAGYGFHSVTLRAFKYEKKEGCVFIGQRAIYKGPFEAVVDEEGHLFWRNEAIEVCTDTAQKLTHPPYAGMFVVLDGQRRPIAQDDDGSCCPPGSSC